MSRLRVFVWPGCSLGPKEYVRCIVCMWSSLSGDKNNLPLTYMWLLIILQSAIATLIFFQTVGVHWRQSGFVDLGQSSHFRLSASGFAAFIPGL